MTGRIALRVAALAYLALLVLGPVVLVVVRTFAHGMGPVVAALTTPDAVHAAQMSLLLVAIAVPVNTVFGVVCAFVLVRFAPRGAGLITALVDLPFAISPVVLGLALFTLYGRNGWLGPALARTPRRRHRAQANARPLRILRPAPATSAAGATPTGRG